MKNFFTKKNSDNFSFFQLLDAIKLKYNMLQKLQLNQSRITTIQFWEYKIPYILYIEDMILTLYLMLLLYKNIEKLQSMLNNQILFNYHKLLIVIFC